MDWESMGKEALVVLSSAVRLLKCPVFVNQKAKTLHEKHTIVYS